MLDLNLPKMDGREVLNHLKEDDRLSTIPTVILTISEADAEFVKSHQLHAKCYLSTLVQSDAFERRAKRINEFWPITVRLPQQRQSG